MYEIDYDSDLDKVLIHGINAARLLKSSAGTTLSVVLGYKSEGGSTLATRAGNHAGAVIADTIRTLENASIESGLSSAAREHLSAHVAYLRTFKTALARGRELKAGSPTQVALPASFRRQLKSFQLLPVQHLIDVPHAATFSVPGSGNTTMVLAAYAKLKSQRVVNKLVVICPRSAFEPWTEEYQGCFGKTPRVLRVAGQPAGRARALAAASDYELFLCTYQMLANEKEAIAKVMRKHPSMLVLDEGHHIKRGEGGVWYAAASEIAPLARRRVILTGTPAPNDLEDLLPQFETLWPGLNPARRAMDAFEETQSIDKFRDTLSPFYTRVRKGELGLPPQRVVHIPVKMGEVQQRIYDVLCNRILPQTLAKSEERALVRDLRKAVVIRLVQAASNPTLLGEYSAEFRVPPLGAAGVDLDQLIRQYSQYEKPEKLLRATRLAVQLARQGKKSIVWTSFVHNAELLHGMIESAGIEAVLVTGGTEKDESSENNRDELLHRFKTRPETKVLVATIPAIAESVSLHRECHNAIYVDRTFNAGLYMQSLDRIHRIGLSPGTDVQYHVLVGTGTLDEVIDSRLQAKMDVMHRVLNDDIGILKLDIPEDLSEGDWDDDDIAAVLEHLRRQRQG